MKYKDKSRLERMVFALGSVAIPGPYSVIRFVSGDRIAARRDDRPADTARNVGSRPDLLFLGRTAMWGRGSYELLRTNRD